MTSPFSRSILALAVVCMVGLRAFSDEDALAFFESRIRPVLIEYCVDCHAADTERSGGLVLDSKAGWEKGGDTGKSIVPGDSNASLLMRAIGYEDPNLQMPPEEKLSPDILNDFRKWIDAGAVDPRSGSVEPTEESRALSVEDAQEHWAYRPISTASAGHSVDSLINERLFEHNLHALPAASDAQLVRRLYFDLTGLPPKPQEIREYVRSESPNKYEELVERLLADPAFGEHVARKWMDVARYAESITLRGFVLPEAWRYRDYLVDAFNNDRPFNLMIVEQLAGDLMQSDSVEELQRHRVATAFLAMGNTNLERQDKQQLEMDLIDEQLEVIGRAFLGQTIGCARCHDHKFDPIPTKDYYALAGILKSAVTLRHDNVSKWIEQPLPLESSQEATLLVAKNELAQVSKRLRELKKQADGSGTTESRFISLDELPGVVIDSAQASLVGEWTVSESVGRIVGENYIHDAMEGRGQKTATLEPASLPPGEYEVRLAYTPFANRSRKVKVRVFSADGEKELEVNQRKKPSVDGVWHSLGRYRFEKDGQAYVLVSNEGADGVVVVDAVQFLPLGAERPAPTKQRSVTKQLAAAIKDADQVELKALETREAELKSRLDGRPKYLTIVEEGPFRDIAVHIRGDVHNLGEVVPRGVLQAVAADQPSIGSDQSGRLQFAEWVADSGNPLPARVYANRVWSWLMGKGLVSSVNNFGTTGTQPSHPMLLDNLATGLIKDGWSTKQLVRRIVLSDAYRRQSSRDSDAAENNAEVDVGNTYYWRAEERRLTAEQMRDAMLSVSGELDRELRGSLIRKGTKADYNYRHGSTRRSVYQPVFRNSLPELFQAFDFADTSVSVGSRARSTVATQALVLVQPSVGCRSLEACGGQSGTAVAPAASCCRRWDFGPLSGDLGARGDQTGARTVYSFSRPNQRQIFG